MARCCNSDTIQLCISSNPKYLKLVRSVILQSALIVGFSEKDSRDVTLAVDEAITNIIKHSYMSSYDKKIKINVNFRDEYLELVLRDYGKKADPKTIKSRDLKDVKPGGLGVFFIKKIMDNVCYDMSPKHGTKLILKKYFYKKNCMDNKEG
ncbi:ATP-binding protein [bacterium]|nr:ATP-binding protein [bacterium]